MSTEYATPPGFLLAEGYLGTRTVQAGSDSDSDSESRLRSVCRLPVGWGRTVEADYRR